MADNDAPDEEHAMAQIDEVTALSMIYDEDLRMISGPTLTYGLDDYQAYDYPISYSVRLSAALNLHVEYPSAYPDVAPRLALLEARNRHHSGSDSGTHGIDTRQLLGAVQNQAEIEVGMPCVLQCVQAGREFIETRSFEATDTTRKTEVAGPDDFLAKEAMKQLDIDPFDTIPRPLLNIILYDLCNVKDRGRLSIASKFIRTIIERRAHRILGKSIHVELDGWNEQRSMTVDGVRRQHWELDVIRAKEEQKVLSNHELLWRRQRTRRFTLSSETDSWWVCEGLPSGVNQAAGHVDRHWISQDYSFHYARASKPIPCHTGHWYVVRVRLRARKAEDGDIFVGLACAHFDDTCAQLFQTIPGGEFGAVSEQCAFINVISAQNSPDGHPMEVNIGLKVKGASVAYGIPRGTFTGRPIYNNSTVVSEIPNSSDGFYGETCQVPVFLAVVAARSTSQSNFHALVVAEECSETEFNRLFEEPYNYL